MHADLSDVLLTLSLFALAAILLSPTTSTAALRPHPRLFFTAEDQARIENLAKTDETLRRLIDANHELAEKLLKNPPVQYRIPDGKRLLSESRTCIRTVATTAMAYRLSGDKRFAERAIEDMLAAAAFKDWNPRHFLDTAEMATALAIGYDWLQDVLTDKQKKTIRDAITRHGLKAGMACYEKGGWWTRGHNNWNQVCNGGMIIGALAIMEHDAAFCGQVVRHARRSIPNGLDVYPPDGAYPEGPSYWHYGTAYTVLTINALQTAQNDDLGISRGKALDRTGDFWIHMVGPTGRFFNFADSGEGWSPAPILFQLDKLYNQPIYSQWHRGKLRAWMDKRELKNRFAAMEIAWYRPPAGDAAKDLPLDSFFHGIQDVVTMRSAWDDPNAMFVGFKGGDNDANHGHLDIGSFVLDVDGIRWASDLGGDNYNMPGYFGGKRWTYYRLNNRSHNTLVIGDRIQNPRAESEITHFDSTPERVEAIADMTLAYKGQAVRALRGVAMLDRKAVLIQDEVTNRGEEIRWGMVTYADVEIQRNGVAIMKEKGKTLKATILKPEGFRITFEIVSTKPPTERERDNKGTRMLAFRTKGDPKGTTRIAILLHPAGAQVERPRVQPLEDWAKE